MKKRRLSVMKYIKSKKILLKNHSKLTEQWLQEKITEEPEILGLGENIEIIEKERRQQGGGRVDLLLKDPESEKRFTVELQLGECDPDHIIRTVEYWDKERKKYPHLKYCAVIIAEDITSRFWNIINLFNGNIPLIAIQLDVRQVENNFTLNFVKVLDEVERGIDEEENSEPADRAYWEKKSTPEVLLLMDSLKSSLNKLDPEIDLNYNKHYIGLKKNNISDNFVWFRPFKKYLCVLVSKKKIAEETIYTLEDEGLIFERKDQANYKSYRIRIPNNKNDLEEKMPAIEKLFKEAGGFKENIKEAA